MIMKIFCAMALMHTIINRRICILMGFVWCFTIQMFQYRALCLAYTHIGMEIVLSGLVIVWFCFKQRRLSILIINTYASRR